ncbi:MAG: alpha/beta fold hydrolase [Actinomycetota bacterium]
MPFAELDDLKLYYRTYGSGSPVLGIMGFGLDQRYWAAQVPTVAERNTFITFDNRGTGRSEGPTISTVDEMADDAIRLLDHLGIEQATVIGVSMGGAIAQRLVLDHPDRVKALVLGITFARPIEYMLRRHEIAKHLVSSVTPLEFMEAAMLWMFTPQFFEIGRESIDQLMRAFSGPGAPDSASPEVLTAQMEALHKHDALAQLHGVSCPTLVFGGRLDMMVPYFASEEIARAIPGAEFVTFETGHGLMFEEMDRFNSVLRDFLDRNA